MENNFRIMPKPHARCIYKTCAKFPKDRNKIEGELRSQINTHCRVFSQHFGNMTRPLELGIFALFYTKLGKNTPYNKNKNIKYFVYSTSYSSLTHKQILKSDLQSDLPFVVGAQKNPLIKMVLLSTHNICFA